jgi:hypothetical protein
MHLLSSRKSVSPTGLPDPPPEVVFNSSFSAEFGKAGYGADGALCHFPHAEYSSRKSEQVRVPLIEISRLDLELGMYTFASLAAKDTDVCVASLRAEAGSSVEAQVIELLDHIKLCRYGSELVLSTPVTTRMATMARCSLEVTTASSFPVSIRGCFSQVEIVKMSGPVTVSLAYGGVSLFETTGAVDVQTGPEGKIVYAGCRGQVVLKSAGEIDLKITDQAFQGSLLASTREMPIRILLPQDFRSSFEVIAPEVTCRADIASQLQRHQLDEEVVARYGSEQPRLRFHSLRGSVVIDNTID